MRNPKEEAASRALTHLQTPPLGEQVKPPQGSTAFLQHLRNHKTASNTALDLDGYWMHTVFHFIWKLQWGKTEPFIITPVFSSCSCKRNRSFLDPFLVSVIKKLLSFLRVWSL